MARFRRRRRLFQNNVSRFRDWKIFVVCRPGHSFQGSSRPLFCCKWTNTTKSFYFGFWPETDLEQSASAEKIFFAAPGCISEKSAFNWPRAVSQTEFRPFVKTSPHAISGLWWPSPAPQSGSKRRGQDYLRGEIVVRSNRDIHGTKGTF